MFQSVILVLRKIRQKLCFHVWAYKRSVILVGIHRAEHICMKCGKLAHVTYGYDQEAGGDVL